MPLKQVVDAQGWRNIIRDDDHKYRLILSFLAA